jgi:dGTPase
MTAQQQLTGDAIFASYRHIVEEQERLTLHPGAALSSKHCRLGGVDDDHRLPYQRDVDRILHSKAYARYVDKTQVAYLIDNDHITHRSLHVQLVSQFSRGIAAILRLNVNLVEAIALGHDVGHPPFGHEGEGYLSRLAQEYIGQPFAHPWQSCRLFTIIEPLHLGLAVYDGFLCHDGGMREPLLRPRLGKTVADYEKDLQAKLADPDGTIIPMTLEGCLVKMCDTMSYIGRDIEDAISLGIITREDVPETCLGVTNSAILSHLARDLIQQSYGNDYIAISEPIFAALHTLRRFNFERIYCHPKLKVESPKIERAYRILFTHLGEELQLKGRESYIWKHFAANKGEAYCSQTPPWQIVVDYIAGMTDKFFVRLFEKLLVPGKIQLWS